MSPTEKIIFQGKYGPWAVVTGASSGIGRAMCLALAKIGLDLVLVGRNQQALMELSQEIEGKFFSKTRILQADLSLLEENRRIIEETKTLGIGLLICSAGMGTSGRFMESKVEDELEMIRVNCLSSLLLSREFGERFAQQKTGGIVLLSSIVAFQGVPFAAHYAASKAYIQSLAEGMHHEMKPYRVDVLAASPGPVKSGFAQKANMVMDQALDPNEIALPILEALGKKMTVYPGFLTKFLTFSLSLLPRWGKVRVMQKVMGGFTQHQR
ncbi:SDR family NAD(P)-dependent oxidoreductase [Algoriphagus confluentis]|uniref:SDR family NAD(P)-dependent oxidoreductase n=1 Tax=Algoriphagus confluentis TaxID=1697556 RepID=A0ABQ6PUT7_9BACT|nr:SDR family NAD(P)-dependent oxidoreductase [Algoriphagus confluentis]